MGRAPIAIGGPERSRRESLCRLWNFEKKALWMEKFIYKFAPSKKEPKFKMVLWNTEIPKSPGRYSSGQRGQTVNLLFLTSQVRILLSPQRFFIRLRRKFTFLSDRMKKIGFGAPESGSPSVSEVIQSQIPIWNLVLEFEIICESSSVGRASAFQAECRRFEPGLSL